MKQTQMNDEQPMANSFQDMLPNNAMSPDGGMPSEDQVVASEFPTDYMAKMGKPKEKKKNKKQLKKLVKKNTGFRKTGY